MSAEEQLKNVLAIVEDVALSMEDAAGMEERPGSMVVGRELRQFASMLRQQVKAGVHRQPDESRRPIPNSRVSAKAVPVLGEAPSPAERGRSDNGRAPASQAGGCGFESRRLHNHSHRASGWTGGELMYIGNEANPSSLLEVEVGGLAQDKPYIRQNEAVYCSQTVRVNSREGCDVRIVPGGNIHEASQ